MKSTHLHIRIDEELKKLISRAAKKSGSAGSSWVRQRLKEAARRELKR